MSTKNILVVKYTRDNRNQMRAVRWAKKVGKRHQRRNGRQSIRGMAFEAMDEAELLISDVDEIDLDEQDCDCENFDNDDFFWSDEIDWFILDDYLWEPF